MFCRKNKKKEKRAAIVAPLTDFVSWLSFSNLGFIWKFMGLGLLIKIMPTEESQKYAEIVPMNKDLPF